MALEVIRGASRNRGAACALAETPTISLRAKRTRLE